MYDWEFRNYLEERNYKLSNIEYLYICRTCPQIKEIKYNSFENNFDIRTDCNRFTFQVYYIESE